MALRHTGTKGVICFKQVKSDSDSHGSSESDNLRESAAPAVQEHAAASFLSDSAVEDESSDKDDVRRRVQALALASPGTVKYINT